MKAFWENGLPVVGVITGIFIAFTPYHLAPVCTKLLELSSGAFVHMTCHWTGKTEVLLGILIAVISLATFIMQYYGLTDRKISGIALIALSIGGFAVPLEGVIGICRNPEMACHTTVRALSLPLLITTITGIALIMTPFKKLK